MVACVHMHTCTQIHQRTKLRMFTSSIYILRGTYGSIHRVHIIYIYIYHIYIHTHVCIFTDPIITTSRDLQANGAAHDHLFPFPSRQERIPRDALSLSLLRAEPIRGNDQKPRDPKQRFSKHARYGGSANHGFARLRYTRKNSHDDAHGTCSILSDDTTLIDVNRRPSFPLCLSAPPLRPRLLIICMPGGRRKPVRPAFPPHWQVRGAEVRVLPVCMFTTCTRLCTRTCLKTAGNNRHLN
jgi:hypothetical protein